MNSRFAILSPLFLAALIALPFAAHADDRQITGGIGTGPVLEHSDEEGLTIGGEINANVGSDSIGTMEYDFNADGSVGIYGKDKVTGSVSYEHHFFITDSFGIEFDHQGDFTQSTERGNLAGVGIRIKDGFGTISVIVDLVNLHHDKDMQGLADISQGIRLATRHFITNELTLDAGFEAAFLKGLKKNAVTSESIEGGETVMKQITPGLVQTGRGTYLAGSVGITFRMKNFFITAKGKLRASLYAVIEQNADGTTGATRDVKKFEKEVSLTGGFAF